MQFEVNQLKGYSATEGLSAVAAAYGAAATFSTSFGMEDQLITHLVATQHLPITVFTLDTGRMFEETYGVWDNTLAKYKIAINTYYPNATAIANFTQQHGPNSFYNSIENRKQCCYLRKVQPLQQALQGKKLWITGIRAAQSPERNLEQVEWDSTNNIYKYHPLLHWSDEEVSEYVAQNKVPINALHKKGFVSIGCAPCTRAITPGEDFRAGRWWWETDKKECGLHVHQ
jgi:phosphoadenosine phosphosulfate reductase